MLEKILLCGGYNRSYNRYIKQLQNRHAIREHLLKTFNS